MNKPLWIKPEYLYLPWSTKSPNEGDPDCTCTLCAEVIGCAEDDPLWELHNADCLGCFVCEFPVRLFKTEYYTTGERTVEQRFHVKCFEKIIEVKP